MPRALCEELISPVDGFDLGEADLFGNTVDLSSNGNIASADDNLASLPPINDILSENTVVSSEPSDLIASYEYSACLTQDPSSSLFSRSDDMNAHSVAESDFCFQTPDGKPATEEPSIAFPNLFDLLQPKTDNLPPFDTFPRRPHCPFVDYFNTLCCTKAGRGGYRWDCVTCTLMLPLNHMTFSISCILLMRLGSRLFRASVPGRRQHMVLCIFRRGAPIFLRVLSLSLAS